MASKVGLSLDGLDLAESIYDIANCQLTNDDGFKSIFITLSQILNSRNLNGKAEENRIEKVLQSMIAIRDGSTDVVNFKYRGSLITAISHVYLKSLGNKANARKTEKILHIVSSIWHTELMDTLLSQVNDLLSSPRLTSEQIMKVSVGLEESKLFREAINKNLLPLLTHLNNIFVNISEHFTSPPQGGHHCTIKERDFMEHVPESLGSHDDGIVENSGYSTTTSGSPVYNHMELCYTCVKVCLQVFQYMPQSVGVLLWEAPSTDQSLSSNLINNLQAVLSQRYSKDCNLIAGSALAMLLNTIPTVKQAMMLTELLCGDHKEPVKIGNTQISSLSHDLQDGPYSKIAIIRGILTCCKPRILLSRRENEGCILLHSLFTEVVFFCQHPNHAILYNAFQLLVFWFESAIETLDPYVNSTPESERKPCFHSESSFVKNTLQLIWENWQNPLTGVPTFVKTTFGLLLQIHHKENQKVMISSSELYSSLAIHLLKMSWHVKGKYALLGSLVPYVGALNLLSTHPTLPRQLVRGLATNFLASAVSDLHRVLLQNMKKEIEQAGVQVAGEDGEAALRWKQIWGDCVLDVLCSEHELIRFHGAQFWLPWILKCFPGAYKLLMTSLDMNTVPSSSTLSSKRRLHAFMMVMAQARLGDIINFTTIEANMPLISIALGHVDDDIRLSALALICNSPKRAQPMQQLELEMLYRFLPLNLNCDGASFRQKMCAYIKAIITRIRDSCLASLKILNRKKPNLVQKTDEKEAAEHILLSGTTFLDWLLRELMKSLFPSACYQRKRAVLGLLAILYEVMLSKWQCNKKKGQTPEAARTLITWAHQHNKCHFICERHCYLLLDNLLDGSNDNRDLAYKILSEYFPWPFPGLNTSGMKMNLILSEGLQLICSPKSPECEAGSKLCVLVFQRHILEGKDLPSRLVGEFKSLKVEISKEGPNGTLPFLRQITESLVYQHKCCAQNILYGSFITPMHGLLLTIRKCLSISVPTLLEIMQSDRDGWRAWITSLLATASDIVSLAMSTLSGPIGGTVGTELSPSFADMGEGIDELIQKIKNCQIEGQQEEEAKILSGFETGEENSAISSSHQLILACCWLNLKEVSLLLGELSQCVPFTAECEEGLLTTNQLQTMTDIFISILTKCRHRGAIEGCNLGFSKLCASLLASPSHELSTIPKGLLQDLILMITNEGSTSSFTKKSAGLPLVLEAVINSEPKGREKSLLQFTMTSLLEIAQQPEPVEHDPKLDLPQCHALNMLKALFRSSAINDDVMPYTSKSVTIAIHGFASKHFSVRNGSMLLFGSLVARMFGQKRVQDEHSRVNSMTACEFFVHYPELRSFLLQEICKCVDQQVAGRQNLHPSLFPVLIILSKLGCGLQSGETSDLNQFIQPVMQLCASPVYQVRALAAEALVPLVAEDKMLMQAACIITSLPGTRQEAHSQNKLHGQLLQVQKLFGAHMDNTLGMPPSSEAYNICRRLCTFQWIGSEENNCPLTRAIFIDTTTKLIAWLVTDRTNTSARSLADDILKIAKCYLSSQHPQLVAGAVLARSMVESLLSLNQSQMLENVQFMFKSRSPDIMVPAQRFLLEKLLDGHPPNIQSLSPFILELLDLINIETDRTCLESSLKLFTEVSKACGYQLHADWLSHWDSLLKLASGVQGVSVTCAALPALGIIVKGILHEAITSCDMQAFCRLLMINSEPTMSESSRLAVASTLQIVGAGILKEFQHKKNEEEVAHVMSVFTAALLLLQDEQTEIRCQATRFVSQLSVEITDKDVEVVQPSYAVQVLIKYICHNFMWSSVCLSDLCRRLSGSPSIEIEIKSQQTVGNLNLFEQEDANIYEEPAKLATFLHEQLLVFVESLYEENPEAVRSWIINQLPDVKCQISSLVKQLSAKVSTCGSFFGMSGFRKPYCMILRKLLYVHLLVSATCFLSDGAKIDLSELYIAASNLTKIQDLHPHLQDQLTNIMKLIQPNKMEK